MIETLLVAISDTDEDRYEELYDQITTLASDETTIVLAHVFKPKPKEADPVRAREKLREWGYDISDPPNPDALARRQKIVSDLQSDLTEDGYSVTVRGGRGDRVEEILSIADDVDADNLLIGGRKRSPTGKVVFGSTAQQLLLNSPIPVTFICAGDSDPKRTVKQSLLPDR